MSSFVKIAVKWSLGCVGSKFALSHCCGYDARHTHTTHVNASLDAIRARDGGFLETGGISEELAATLRGSRPGVQSASLIMTSLMTS